MCEVSGALGGVSEGVCDRLVAERLPSVEWGVVDGALGHGAAARMFPLSLALGRQVPGAVGECGSP